MALATVTGQPYDLAVDSRWKHWGKLIRGEQDIKLGEKNGYSLTGPFVRWGETVALERGQFLVLAAESGSRKYATYDYRLIGVGEDGEVAAVSDAAITTLLDDAHLPDAVRAKCANSTLYRYAAYAWAVNQTADAAPAPAGTDPVEAARAALLALSPEQRNRLLTEMLGQ